MKTATAAERLTQPRRFLPVALKLEHHSADVLVILMWKKETQAFLRVAPTKNLNWLLARAPGVHLRLSSHVKINGVTSGKRPTVIVHPINLSGRRQPESRAHWPARPIGGCAPDFRRLRLGLYDDALAADDLHCPRSRRCGHRGSLRHYRLCSYSLIVH